MTRLMKWAAIAAAVIVSLGLAALAYVYIVSELILDRTYQLSPSKMHVTATREAAARGAHLVQIYGCASCHGRDLAGGLFDDIPGTILWSSNLSLLAKRYSDADFDRAIRQGLRADGTSVVLMPSNAFSALRDDEVADIVSNIRGLPARGEQRPPPRLGLFVRAGLVFGQFHTIRDSFAGQKSPLDLGAKYEAGRHLAQTGCSECHSSDLRGAAAIGPMPARPDLELVAAYGREDFLKFMRTGKAAGNRELPMMSDVARARFSHFTDAEVGILYDYLVARGNALVAKGQ